MIVSAPTPLVIVARLVAAIGLYLLVLTVMVTLLYVGAFLVSGVAISPAKSTAWSMLGLAIADGAAVGTVLLLWRHLDRRILASIGLRREHAFSYWLRGAAVGALMMCTVVFAWYLLVDGAAWAPNQDTRQATFALIAGFVGFLVQGPSEELLFRGYVFENIRGRWGITWGVGISSLAFSLLHTPNPGYGALPFINLFLFGVAMCLWRLRIDHGQLWGVFAIHTVWNWLQQVVFGLPNSGTASPPEDTLLTIVPNISVPGPIWGGGFGPEGTLGTTIVLLAVIAACWRAGRTRRAVVKSPFKSWRELAQEAEAEEARRKPQTRAPGR